MENVIYTFTPSGSYKYPFEKILSIYIDDNNRGENICAGVHFITMHKSETGKVIYCNGPDYIVYKGKKYHGLDDIYKLQTLIEREKINDMLGGM